MSESFILCCNRVEAGRVDQTQSTEDAVVASRRDVMTFWLLQHGFNVWRTSKSETSGVYRRTTGAVVRVTPGLKAGSHRDVAVHCCCHTHFEINLQLIQAVLG
jgi:hypothetical protein